MRFTEKIEVLGERLFPILSHIFRTGEFTTYVAALQVPPPPGSTFAAHEQRVREFLKNDDRIITRRGANKYYFRIRDEHV